MIVCGQVCMYNFKDGGCLKPASAVCPMSNMFVTETNVGHKMTNADRIRAMSDEELAELLMWYCPYPNRKEECEQGCEKCVAEWLKSPAKEDA